MDPSSLQYQHEYDPTQSQPYDPSSAAYYSFHQYNQHLQHQHTSNFPYYPLHQDYSNYQSHPDDSSSSSIHPPGVVPDHYTPYDRPYSSYSAYHHHHQQQQQLWEGGTSHGVGPEAVGLAGGVGSRSTIEQAPFIGGGRRGGRGSGGFGSSFRGRGRGRGRGGAMHQPTPGAPPQQTVPAPKMAWCELCRVDCNTPEILEMHRNGKKHKKNLKNQEELERLNKIIVERQNEKVEEIATLQEGETNVDNKKQNLSGNGGRGRGSKRKMRGGKGAKRARTTADGPRIASEPTKPKPKQPMVPFVCELCHVTCESQVVFDSHLNGKKHMGNLNHLQEQQTLLGQAALEALYPALEAILPQLQDGVQDPQVVLTKLLTSMLASASTSAPGLPPVAENQGVQDQKPVDLQIQPEAKSQLKTESINSGAELFVEIEKKSENLATGTMLEEKVDANSAVEPLHGTGADLEVELA